MMERRKEDWINKKWRPMMAMSYLVTCLFDFVIFPVLWSLLQVYANGTTNLMWSPLTLQGGGLYHLAMGAVVGITAWGRSKEKTEWFKIENSKDSSSEIEDPVK